MVRSALAMGVFVAAGLAFTAPAMAAQAEPGGGSKSTDVSPAPPPQPSTAPVKRLVPCSTCADPACRDLRLDGVCTVNEALAALRRHEQAMHRALDEPRHRSRSVTGADYERLILDDVPEPGRAGAAPHYAPQGEADGRDLRAAVEDGNEPPLESDSLSAKAHSFRRLDLSEEASDDEESLDDADSEEDSQDR